MDSFWRFRFINRVKDFQRLFLQSAKGSDGGKEREIRFNRLSRMNKLTRIADVIAALGGA